MNWEAIFSDNCKQCVYNKGAAQWWIQKLGRGATNMKSIRLPLHAVFFLTYFYRSNVVIMTSIGSGGFRISHRVGERGEGRKTQSELHEPIIRQNFCQKLHENETI